MNIIEGQLPEDKAWRALLLLSPGEELGKVWQLGLAVARANGGQFLTAVFCSSLNRSDISRGRVMLLQVQAAVPEKYERYVYPLLVTAVDIDKGVNEFVEEAEVDLLLANVDGPVRHNLNRVPCAVAIVRGDTAAVAGDPAATGAAMFEHIVMPTSGGPNTAHALQLLLRLSTKIRITLIYIARSYLGPNEEALGRSRLRQLTKYLDAGDRIETKVVVADSVEEGIVSASSGCDLVIIGASKESSMDKVLFGDVPAAVVRHSNIPVMIVRQPQDRIRNLWGWISWRLQKLLPRMELSDRTEAYTRIRRSARPDIDFFMLISLAAIIAALGLMTNSGAVVIGAMLVAPLMSPIVGIGMAIVLGDARFLRLSSVTVLKGALLAILVGMLAGLLLRIFNLELTDEILARTQPSLLDLGIALFSGLAAAFALSRSDAAGALPGVAIAAALVPPLATVGITFSAGYFFESIGALLLFITNLVAISSATALMFLILGFRPARAQESRRQVQLRSVRIALLSLVIVSSLLIYSTYQLTQEQATNARIEEVTTTAVREITGGELSNLDFVFGSDETGQQVIEMELIVRSVPPVGFSSVEQLQETIGTTLQSEGITDKIALRMSVIRVTELNPLVPPTASPTPTETQTLLPGITPSATPLPSATPSPIPSATSTPVPTDSPVPAATASPPPTATASPPPTVTAVPTLEPTSTPPTAVVQAPFGVNLRAEPGINEAIIGFLGEGTAVILLEGVAEVDGLVWQEVLVESESGWLSAQFLGENPG